MNLFQIKSKADHRLSVFIKALMLAGFVLSIALLYPVQAVNSTNDFIIDTTVAHLNSQRRDPLDVTAYPTDPTADIPWSAGFTGVADIESAFNAARTMENAQLGTSMPALTMPTQVAWDAMRDGEKALWLINREREDRGLDPMHGVEANVTQVAQNYAQYLFDNNATGHTADGHDPWWRLNQNSAINACHDFLSVAENLAYFWSSADDIALPMARSIYMWMYENSASAWGHRHTMLWYPYNDNYGSSPQEGFLGVGRVSGPHMGWPYSEIVVMNVFDPCATGVFYTPSSIQLQSFSVRAGSGLFLGIGALFPSVLVVAGGVVAGWRKYR